MHSSFIVIEPSCMLGAAGLQRPFWRQGARSVRVVCEHIVWCVRR
jgi:hypothetical protein